MPIRGSTQRRLSFHGAGRDHPDWVGRKRSYPLVESVEEACVSLCSGVYWRHASDETSHSPLSLKLGNGRARSWRGGLHRDPQCAKAIPQGRGERDCYRYLLGQMQATPDRPHGTKTEIENILPRAFSRKA